MKKIVLIPAWECIRCVDVRGKPVIDVEVVKQALQTYAPYAVIFVVDRGASRYFSYNLQHRLHFASVSASRVAVKTCNLRSFIDAIYDLQFKLNYNNFTHLYVDSSYFSSVRRHDIDTHLRPDGEAYANVSLAYRSSDWVYYKFSIAKIINKVCDVLNADNLELSCVLLASSFCLNTENQIVGFSFGKIKNLELSLFERYGFVSANNHADNNILVVSDIDNTLFDVNRSNYLDVTVLNDSVVTLLQELCLNNLDKTIYFFPLTSRYSPKLQEIRQQRHGIEPTVSDGDEHAFGSMAHLLKLLCARMSGLDNFTLFSSSPVDELHFTRTPVTQTRQNGLGKPVLTAVPKLWVLMDLLKKKKLPSANTIFFIDDDSHELAPWHDQALWHCDAYVMTQLLGSLRGFSHQDYVRFLQLVTFSSSCSGHVSFGSYNPLALRNTEYLSLNKKFTRAFEVWFKLSVFNLEVNIHLLRSHTESRLVSRLLDDSPYQKIASLQQVDFVIETADDEEDSHAVASCCLIS